MSEGEKSARKYVKLVKEMYISVKTQVRSGVSTIDSSGVEVGLH